MKLKKKYVALILVVSDHLRHNFHLVCIFFKVNSLKI